MKIGSTSAANADKHKIPQRRETHSTSAANADKHKTPQRHATHSFAQERTKAANARKEPATGMENRFFGKAN